MNEKRITSIVVFRSAKATLSALLSRSERRHYVRMPVLWAVILIFWLCPETAMAHIDSGEAGGFLSGVSHPISGLDHVLAMVAVGLWGAQLGKPAMWLLPVAFPMMMAFGGMLGLIGVPVPGVEIGIAVSGIVLGAMVLGEVKAPLAVSITLVAVFAVFHGHAHGTELSEGQNAMLYSLGFVISTGTLHAVGIGIGTVHKWKAGQVALRVAGALVMIGGLTFLWSALT
jgi:urease accessory protein